MPRVTVSQRTRHQLNRLLKQPGFSKTALAAYCQKPGSWLSAFLHPNPQRSSNPSFHLDELDDIAAYFRISIGELLGAPKAGDLSGDESRLLLAFRALPPAVQDHFLALVETASLAPRQVVQRTLTTRRKAGVGSAPEEFLLTPTAAGVAHGRTVSDADAATELARLRAAVTQAALDLSTAATGAGHDRSHAAVDPRQTPGRDLAG